MNHDLGLDQLINVTMSALAFLACAIFAAVYHVKAPWWRSTTGWNLMGFMRRGRPPLPLHRAHHHLARRLPGGPSSERPDRGPPRHIGPHDPTHPHGHPCSAAGRVRQVGAPAAT